MLRPIGHIIPLYEGPHYDREKEKDGQPVRCCRLESSTDKLVEITAGEEWAAAAAAALREKKERNTLIE